ncbi:hypoxanthine phosphoribosyltransferase [Olivibacter ginsenosidimutans]|uniref:Hypoxanthine phosphoribosyltransferase n=1 Tax=Olivibacter ginsenosidimutans TaxID=1176537 RepID=A0ABP9ALI6_9SPHI
MKIEIDHKDFELMITHEQVKKRLRLIGIQLNVVYENRVPIFIGVLNGCFMFLADLMKQIHIASEVCFVKLASYEGENRRDEIIQLIGLNHDLKGREVIIVEDIVDTGNTLRRMLDLVKALEPASVAICTLLLKPDALAYQFEELAYVGFEIENQFVVGYGLDYNGLGRNLKDIYRAV